MYKIHEEVLFANIQKGGSNTGYRERNKIREIRHNTEGMNRVQFLCAFGKLKAATIVNTMYIL